MATSGFVLGIVAIPVVVFVTLVVVTFVLVAHLGAGTTVLVNENGTLGPGASGAYALEIYIPEGVLHFAIHTNGPAVDLLLVPTATLGDPVLLATGPALASGHGPSLVGDADVGAGTFTLQLTCRSVGVPCKIHTQVSVRKHLAPLRPDERMIGPGAVVDIPFDVGMNRSQVQISAGTSYHLPVDVTIFRAADKAHADPLPFEFHLDAQTLTGRMTVPIDKGAYVLGLTCEAQVDCRVWANVQVGDPAAPSITVRVDDTGAGAVVTITEIAWRWPLAWTDIASAAPPAGGMGPGGGGFGASSFEYAPGCTWPTQGNLQAGDIITCSSPGWKTLVWLPAAGTYGTELVQFHVAD
jgi:hypothetical protein